MGISVASRFLGYGPWDSSDLAAACCMLEFEAASEYGRLQVDLVLVSILGSVLVLVLVS